MSVPDIAQFLYEFPPFYAAIGFVAGFVLLNLRGQGTQAWARHPLMILAIPGTSAAIAFVIARISPSYGSPVVMQTLLGSWAWAWGLFGLIALWRNNVVVGLMLDRFFIYAGIAVALGTGFVYYMVRGVDHPNVNWAYVAVPSLAGAIYRLLLVVAYLRAPVTEREALGTRLERGLKGLMTGRFRAKPAGPEQGALFTPPAQRSAARREGAARPAQARIQRRARGR